MKVLNICMNAPFTEKYSYQDNLLTEYQKKLGHEVAIITSTRTRDEQGRICYTKPCDKILENGVRLIRINGGNKIQLAVGFYPKLKKYIDRCQPQMMFIHGLCSFVPTQAIRYKKGQKEDCVIVADNHQDTRNTKVSGFPFGAILLIYRLFWKCWIKYVDKVYGTTNWRKRFAKEYYGIPEHKLDILVTGIDTDRLPKDRQSVRKNIRAKLGIEDNKFVFIAGGKLDYQKKIIETIRAFKRIDNQRVVLLIFGSVASEMKQKFDNLIKKDSRIIYLNRLDSWQIKEYFIASDMGVFAGGHSVLWEEAKGCGLPCIFSKYDEEEISDMSDGCIRLEKITEENLYEQLQLVTKSKEMYNRLKKNAEIGAETFSYFTIAKKSLECAIKY